MCDIVLRAQFDHDPVKMTNISGWLVIKGPHTAVKDSNAFLLTDPNKGGFIMLNTFNDLIYFCQVLRNRIVILHGRVCVCVCV